MRRLVVSMSLAAALVVAFADDDVGAGHVRRAEGRTPLTAAAAIVPESRVPSPQSRVGNPRPNLLMIVTDDQASWTLGSYGNADARTTQIDRIASRGRSFRQRVHAVARLLAEPRDPALGPVRHRSRHHRLDQSRGGRGRRRPAAADRHVGRGAAAAPATAPASSANGTSARSRSSIRRGMAIEHFVGFLAGGTTPMDPTARGERRRAPVPWPGAGRGHGRGAALSRTGARAPLRALASLPGAAHALRTGARPGHGAVSRRAGRHPGVSWPGPGAGAAMDAGVLREHPLDRPQHRSPARQAAAVRPRPDHRGGLHERPRLQHRTPRPAHEGQRHLDRRWRQWPDDAEHVRHVVASAIPGAWAWRGWRRARRQRARRVRGRVPDVARHRGPADACRRAHARTRPHAVAARRVAPAVARCGLRAVRHPPLRDRAPADGARNAMEAGAVVWHDHEGPAFRSGGRSRRAPESVGGSRAA